jgi:hypothetical protein
MIRKAKMNAPTKNISLLLVDNVSFRTTKHINPNNADSTIFFSIIKEYYFKLKGKI